MFYYCILLYISDVCFFLLVFFTFVLLCIVLTSSCIFVMSLQNSINGYINLNISDEAVTEQMSFFTQDILCVCDKTKLLLAILKTKILILYKHDRSQLRCKPATTAFVITTPHFQLLVSATILLGTSKHQTTVHSTFMFQRRTF